MNASTRERCLGCSLWLLEDLQTSAAGKSIRLRGPGKAAYLFGDRLPSLTHSLRVSNARFRTATGRAPRYPAHATAGMATAIALRHGRIAT